MSKKIFIIACLLISLVFFYLSLTTANSPNITISNNKNSSIIAGSTFIFGQDASNTPNTSSRTAPTAYIELAVAIISLIGAIIGLVSNRRG